MNLDALAGPFDFFQPSQAEQQRLLMAWPDFCAKAERIRRAVVAMRGGGPDVAAARDRLSQLQIQISEGNEHLQRAIDNAKAAGKWEPAWPQNIGALIAWNPEPSGISGMGIWPLVIAVVLIAAAVAAVFWIVAQSVEKLVASMIVLVQQAGPPAVGLGAIVIGVILIGGLLLGSKRKRKR